MNVPEKARSRLILLLVLFLPNQRFTASRFYNAAIHYINIITTIYYRPPFIHSQWRVRPVHLSQLRGENH